MAGIIGDLGSMLGVDTNLATKSTSRKGNTELNMNDFLQLMIVQLTNQTIDDTMDTSEMMNQMLQMQMISAMSNMTDINVQSYANSLVNQVVTVGIVNGNVLEERAIQVMGTGSYNGQQVIFGSDGNMYYLSQIMAVGLLPNEDGTYGPQAGDSTGDGDEKVEGPEGENNKNENTDNKDDNSDVAPGTDEISAAAQAIDSTYKGEMGTPADAE